MIKIFRFISFLFFGDVFIFASLALLISNYVNSSISEIILPLTLFTFLSFYFLYLKGYYSVRKYEFFFKDGYLLFEGLLLSYLLTFLIMFFVGLDITTYHFLISDFLAVFVVLYIWRAVFYEFRKKVLPKQSIILIGTIYETDLILKEIQNRDEYKLNIAKTIENDNIEEIKKSIKSLNPRLIIVSNELFEKVSSIAPSEINIIKTVDFYEYIAKKIPVKIINESWFKDNFTTLKQPFELFLKRTFDVIASVIILTLTMPILILIGIGIKLYDDGPIIYEQQRVGKDGKPFKMYKLRTMYIGADKAGMVDKGNTKDDRIIPFCRLVRKARFDEIPQMINILKGDMSVVGPRAEFIDFVKKYEQEIAFYTYRHSVTPGWTGWAQISQGHCVALDAITEKLCYDFYYIKHKNIFWDLSILLKAVGLALTGRHG